MGEFLRLLESGAAEPTNINDQWGLIGSTVVTGLVVVFMILAILVLFLWLFGKIFKAINESGDKKARRKIKMNNKMKSFKLENPSSAPAVPAAPAAQAVVPDEPEYEEEDDEEIIAVIAAAIAAFGEAEGKQYRIASIKRPRGARSGWSSAGIADNMRSFIN